MEGWNGNLWRSRRRRIVLWNRVVGAGGTLGNISFITSATIDAASIVIPATAKTGDFCVFYDAPAKGTAVPTPGVPIASVTPTGVTGWTALSLYNSVPRNDIAIFAWGKILQSGDAGASVTGTNTATNAGFRRKTILVFRRSTGFFTSFSDALSVNNEGTSGDPVAQTVTSSSGPSPLIVLSTARGTQAVVSYTFTPTQDGSISNGTTVVSRYKIYNSSPSNVTIDCGDVGDSTMLQSFYVRMS